MMTIFSHKVQIKINDNCKTPIRSKSITVHIEAYCKYQCNASTITNQASILFKTCSFLNSCEMSICMVSEVSIVCKNAKNYTLSWKWTMMNTLNSALCCVPKPNSSSLSTHFSLSSSIDRCCKHSMYSAEWNKRNSLSDAAAGVTTLQTIDETHHHMMHSHSKLWSHRNGNSTVLLLQPSPLKS